MAAGNIKAQLMATRRAAPMLPVLPLADFSTPVNTIAWFAASDGLVSEDHKIAAKLLRLD